MKYFIVSDVHGCYDEMIRGLEDAGYDFSNPDHIFVSLGDLFDRGDKSYECLQFVNNLPDDKKILIYGNHETCLQEAIWRKYFRSHDSHNKTDKTCWEFYKIVHPEAEIKDIDQTDVLRWLESWEELKKYFDSLKYYFVVGNNVFLHGWAPYWCRYLEDLSKADWVDWWDSVWTDGCQYVMRFGIKLKTDSSPNAEILTVFCGHIHSFWLNNKYHQKGEITVDENGDIDLSKIDNTPFIDTGIVNLDSYSYKSGKVNVYVLEI